MTAQKPYKNRQEDSPDRGHPLAQGQYERAIEKRIAEAMAEGLFDDLPGAGKPLALEDDSMVPEEDRVAFRMLKNAGFAPPWIEIQQSIAEEQSKLATWLEQTNRRWSRLTAEEHTRVRAEYQQKLSDLNKLITSYNLIVPPVVGQMPLLQLWRELRKLGVAE